MNQAAALHSSSLQGEPTQSAERSRLQAVLTGTRGALDLRVSLELTAGITLLTGPNGAGKSTLLRALLGALPSCRGTVSVDGRCVFDSARAIDVPVEGRQMAYVPAVDSVIPHMTVRRNLAFFAAGPHPEGPLASRPRSVDIDVLLDRFLLRDLAARPAGELSAGERQRVALARSLALGASVLLLDEPMAHVHRDLRPPLLRALRESLAECGAAALLVSHHPDELDGTRHKHLVMDQGVLEGVLAMPGPVPR